MEEREEREISLEIPEGMELSEEEMSKVVSATQNGFVGIVRGARHLYSPVRIVKPK
jgi:hypothetical protein